MSPLSTFRSRSKGFSASPWSVNVMRTGLRPWRANGNSSTWLAVIAPMASFGPLVTASNASISFSGDGFLNAHRFHQAGETDDASVWRRPVASHSPSYLGISAAFWSGKARNGEPGTPGMSFGPGSATISNLSRMVTRSSPPSAYFST